MKAVQVVATYFGERRNYPTNAVQVVEVLNQQIELLQNFDVGCNCDFLIVNHDIESPQVYDYLSSIEGAQLKNGVIKVLHRPILNKDLSFGSYKYAFHKLKDKYDYWYFTEDDILPLRENYIKEMIDTIENDSSIGFVASLNFAKHKVHYFTLDKNNYIEKTGNHPPHAHGGIGLTTTKILQNLKSSVPEYFNTPNINPKVFQSNTIEGGYASDQIEIDFTNAFCKIGYKLKAYSPGTYFKRLQDGSFL